MSAHPNWGLRCKGKKKIAYAQGLCDFFGVKCKGGDICQTVWQKQKRCRDNTRNTQMIFGKMNIERMEYPTTSWDNRRIYA